ncbi:MAG: methyltransferase domain-containing protein [Dehalococcoidia bacterium]|jgi:trans-aconitate 2-methyltransferase|nr:methyltransferase domain-containing protein [Dehalococcoidia bacterium]
MAGSSAWDPDQYQRFQRERSQPFYDLAALVEREPGMRVVDLGCGTGTLTNWLHEELGARETVGVDASPSMLDQAMPLASQSAPDRASAEGASADGRGTLRFERGDIAQFEPDEPFDLVFSNAALQWVEGHEPLLARLARAVAPGGQLAVQVPANDDHVSHRSARALAAGPAYRELLGGYERVFPVLTPVRYAELLHELGFARQQVRMQVYAHVLPETRAVIEWVKGSLLTPFRERLPAAAYERFLAEYERELLAAEGDRAPYLYAFKRILLWARRE